MVTTRSAARAAAAAAAAAAKEAASPAPAASKPAVDRADDPRAASTLTRATDPAPKVPMSSRVGLHLWLGHAVAAVAVLTTVHAALQPAAPAREALPLHALLLLLCTVPLRARLARPSRTRAATRAPLRGAELAQQAASLFASNALHLLAILRAPPLLRLLLGPAVLNAAAVWLRMAVAAATPDTATVAADDDDDDGNDRRVLSARAAMLASAADCFLAASVAGRAPLRDVLEPLFWLRVVVDLRLLLVSAAAIVRRDELSKRPAVVPASAVPVAADAVAAADAAPAADTADQESEAPTKTQ